MQQKEQLIWAVEVDLIKDFQCCHFSLLRRYGWLMWMKMQYIHWSATTLTSRVNNIGYLVSMQCSSGETFGLLDHWTWTIHQQQPRSPMLVVSHWDISLWHTTKAAQECLEEHDEGLWCRPRLQIPPDPNWIKHLWDLLDRVWSTVAPVHTLQDLPPMSCVHPSMGQSQVR